MRLQPLGHASTSYSTIFIEAAKEIEYKYLIERPDIDTLTSMDDCRRITIIQFYLTSSPGEERRVRQLEEFSNRTFVKTIKRKTGERATRLEEEEVISFVEYTKLIQQEADPDCQPVIKNALPHTSAERPCPRD